MAARSPLLLASLLFLLLAFPVLSDPSLPEISFEKFVLDNGLTLIVHEDHKAPIAAVNVWYHVGSKNEKPGRTGFAHLFEHLMFNGSENYNDDYFKAFDRVGATEMNGTTNSDRTNYFQNVPTSALDMALWMESDRMGHLLGAIDQARLDEQRGVVQNEKRQGENQPYGRVFGTLVENAYPAGHPYSWSTIGHMEDLEAASLEDVHEWFNTYYGAANAVIVVAGDVDAQAVKQKVEHYFGDIPSGPPVMRQEAWIAPMAEEHRVVLEDRVPQARVVKVWNVPPVDTAASDYLQMAATILADGKTSRLYKRLVYEDRIASDVTAFAWAKELSGQLVVWADALPGGDLAAVERALDEEIERFRRQGPTAAELERVKAATRGQFIRGIERVGGFGGKSDILASSEIYGGRPDHYRVQLERQMAAAPSDIQGVVREWLGQGKLVIEVRPFAERTVAETGADRSTVPATSAPPTPRFPAFERATLANGLEIVLAERDNVPLVSAAMVIDAGYAADAGRLPGTTNLVMDMLDEGTGDRSALEISEELARLGASIQSGASLDTSQVTLQAIGAFLDPSFELFADLILDPTFPDDELERKKTLQLAAIEREKVQPFMMALRVFPRLIYGDDHAYAVPFTGSGTARSLPKIERGTLTDYHRTWFRPNNATLVVAGDISMADLRPKVEKLFGAWQRGPVPEKNIAKAEDRTDTPLYLIDRPDSIQSVIVCGHVVPPKRNANEAAIETMNQILGGSFTSRINMNLREDKHWSYGASSFMLDARGQRPFLALAPVQTDKTKESMLELQKEVMGIMGDQPPTADEVAKAKDQQTLTLAGRWETNRAVMSSLVEMVQFDLADDHWNAYPESIKQLSRDQVTAAAKQILAPDQTIWVVVGDREKVEPGLRDIGFTDIRVIDADGEPVPGAGGASAGGAP